MPVIYDIHWLCGIIIEIDGTRWLVHVHVSLEYINILCITLVSTNNELHEQHEWNTYVGRHFKHNCRLSR